MTLLIANI